MKYDYDVESAPEEAEVLLFCLTHGGEVACLARMHWFVWTETDNSQTRRQGWQSTWDGAEIPREWRPYAWGRFEAADPAVDLKLPA